MSGAIAGYRRLRRRSGRYQIGPYRAAGAWGRAAMLYLVSRRFLQTVLAMAAMTVMIWWTMHQTPTESVPGMDLPVITGRNETLLLHIAAALLASVIGLAVFTPFGETERVSPVVLPAMRALHVLLLLAIGLGALSLVIGSWADVMHGVDLVPLFVRNALFLTGLVLLAGKVVDVRLAWMVPVVLAGVTMTSLLRRLDGMRAPEELWRDNGRNVLALDLSHGRATAVCLVVGIGALAVYVRDGVRDSPEGE